MDGSVDEWNCPYNRQWGTTRLMSRTLIVVEQSMSPLLVCRSRRRPSLYEFSARGTPSTDIYWIIWDLIGTRRCDSRRATQRTHVYRVKDAGLVRLSCSLTRAPASDGRQGLWPPDRDCRPRESNPLAVVRAWSLVIVGLNGLESLDPSHGTGGRL